MHNFSYYLPTRFVFGRGAEEQAGEMTRQAGGTHALIHYGGGSALRSGLIDKVEDSLQKAGVRYALLGGAQPNPLASKVYEGIRLIREEKIDFIIAVGGGSAMDSAKAMALGAVYEGDFWDFFCGKAVPQAHLPVGTVLTIAASGSESSNSAVITKDETREKRGLNVELNRPVYALMNPEWTYSLPPYQTACGATDIMAHVLERYFTNEPGVDLTDRLCEAVLSAVIAAAPKALKHPEDYDARAQLMWAGTIAHNETVGVGRVGDWASHKIEHELSARYGVAHGAGLAVVLPAWMRYQMRNDTRLLCQLAVRVWGCELDFEHPERTVQAGINATREYFESLGMPSTLGDLGLREADIPVMCDKCTGAGSITFPGIVPIGRAEAEEIFRLCL